VEVVPREDVNDSAALERFVASVRRVAPDATGSAVWLIEWGRVTWQAMLRALLGGMACMVVFLLLLWRSWWDTLLAFFPLALAALLTCVSLVVLGQPFNFANVIVIPMLIGMGVDNGVHLVHRHRTNPEEVDLLGSSTAQAVFYAALTTMLSFGVLGLTSHRGMAAIGQLLAIGVAVTLFCYIVVLPAVLEWDDRRRSE
jgi:predicted RND superfamily exporter protein